MRTTHPLHDGWTVTAVGGEVPAELIDRSVRATVPGCVHLDLMAAGVIPDPYLAENELSLGWIGRVDWRYATSFEWAGTAATRVDLVALGLDTVATVELNGVEVARPANMHRSYRWDVSALLRPGRNELVVIFSAGIPAAEEAARLLGPRVHVNTHPFNAVRKMACNFGWDWGPDLVTAGIWRPLQLEAWSGARIAAARPLVDVDGTTGLLRAHVDVERGDAARPLDLTVTVGGRSVTVAIPPGETSAVVEMAVPDADLWWPHGYGDQSLYGVDIGLRDADGELDAWRGRVGFRTVGLDTSPDEHGTRYVLSVNGVELFARGVNWIPDDCFPSRITRERYAERLRQGRDANVNLVRVWGGGIYESDDFYDVCDELGLLVWQDFPFACAAYAEEEPLRGEVVAEARKAVTRLSPHPSLAIWNGGNESIWGHEDWGWKQELGSDSWGWGYYVDVLPAIVAELDPTRPYSPGSPFSFAADRHPNDPAHGTMHIWDVWNQRDYTAYADYVPRFVAEFGFQGPATWATLTDAIGEPSDPDSPAMLVHQKAEDGNAKLARGLEPHLPAPESFAEWHWATSLNQARAIAFGVAHFRAAAPICMGTVLWQLNDCWPVTSWSAIDGAGRRKPLWYALRAVYADRLLTIQPSGDGLALVAINDSPGRWLDTVVVGRRGMDGSVRATDRLAVDVPPRSVVRLPLAVDLCAADDPSREVLVADGAGSARAWWPFREDLEADLPAPEMDVAATTIEGGYRVEVTARSYLRDLALLADRVAPDAVVDEMLVSLLPGESVTFQVRTAARLDPAQLTGPLVLRTANQLLRAAADARGAVA